LAEEGERLEGHLSCGRSQEKTAGKVWGEGCRIFRRKRGGRKGEVRARELSMSFQKKEGVKKCARGGKRRGANFFEPSRTNRVLIFTAQSFGVDGKPAPKTYNIKDRGKMHSSRGQT